MVTGSLAACGALPDAARSRTEAKTATTDAVWTRTAKVSPQTAWWRQLEDSTLRSLIESALADNADLRQAAARTAALRQAEAAAQSRLFPQAQAQIGVSQTETGLPDAVKRAGQPDVRAVRGTIDFSWELDFFGAARAATRASKAEVLVSMHQQQASAQVVAGEVAKSYILWQSAIQRDRLSRALLAEQEAQFAMRQHRHSEGLISTSELARVEAELAESRSLARAAEPQIAASRARLLTLLHRTSGQPLPAPSDAMVQSLSALPGLLDKPSLEVLRSRPDVLAVEMQLEVEGARWDEARAQSWPRVLLGASVGQQELRLNGLQLAGSFYRNVLAAFTMPLFNRGRLQAQQDAQGARTAAAQLQWEKVMLTAVEEVDATLALQSQQRERVRDLEQALAMRQTHHQAVEAFEREGLVDGLTLRDSRRAVFAARLQLLDAQTQAALCDLQLLRATGGAGTSAPTRP